MKEQIKRHYNSVRHYNELINLNREAIDNKNKSVLEVLLLSGSIVMLIMLIISIFELRYLYMTNAYIVLFSLLVFLLLIVMFAKRTSVTSLMYIMYFVLISYSCITSSFVTPMYICVTVLLFILLFPVLFIDKGSRMSIISLSSSFIYLSFIYHFKYPDRFIDECFNVTSFITLSTIVGSYTRHIQIKNVEYERILSQNAYIDQLTGIYNRRKFFERISESERYGCKNAVSSFAMIDIDNFKLYNDTYGHQVGDMCLSQLGKCFKVFESEFGVEFFRYGGEEFSVVSSHHTREEFIDICERLVRHIPEITIGKAEDNIKKVSVSMGISFLIDSGSGKYTDVIEMGDKALYMAKATGKNRAVVYTPEISDVKINIV